MTFASGIIFTYKQDDLTSSHPVQRYPLGFAANIVDDTQPFDCIFIYCQAGAAGCIAYGPQEIDSLFKIAPPSNPRGNIKNVVPQFEIGPNEYGFAQFKGKCKGNVKDSGNNGMQIGHYFKADVSLGVAFADVGANINNPSVGSVLEPIAAGETKIVEMCLLGKESQVSA